METLSALHKIEKSIVILIEETRDIEEGLSNSPFSLLSYALSSVMTKQIQKLSETRRRAEDDFAYFFPRLKRLILEDQEMSEKRMFQLEEARLELKTRSKELEYRLSDVLAEREKLHDRLRIQESRFRDLEQNMPGVFGEHLLKKYRHRNGNNQEIHSIRIEIYSSEIKPTELGFFIWSFSTALSSIEGVEFSLEEMIPGSRKLFGFLRFKTPKANRETRELLRNATDEGKRLAQKAKDAGEAYAFDQHIENVEKLKAEKEKIQAEKEILRHQTLSKEQAEEHKNLDLEERKLELEQKRLTNEALKLDLSMKRLEALEKAEELAERGLLIFDKVEVHINDVLYLETNKGKITEVNNLDDLASENEEGE